MKHNRKNVFSQNLRALRDMHRLVPGSVGCAVLTAVTQSLSPYVTVWFSARLIDELAGMRRPDRLLYWAAWTLGLTAIRGVWNALLQSWSEKLRILGKPMRDRAFLDKFLSMDYSDLDSQDVHAKKAQIDQLQFWPGYGMNKTLQLTQTLLQGILGCVGAVAMTISLFTQQVPDGQWGFLNSCLFPALFLIAIGGITWGAAALSHCYTSREADLAEASAFSNRMFSAYCRLVTDPSRRLDIRTYNQQELCECYLPKNIFGVGNPFDRLAKGKYGVLAAVGKGLGAVLTGLIYLFTCLKAWAGAFGVGSVTQYVSAVTALSANLRNLLEVGDQFRANTQFLDIVYSLLDLPERKGAAPSPEKLPETIHEIEFRNVSFRYPGSSQWALSRVNLKFSSGEHLAVVGENGSGKTTFVKLLCRLYDPQEGQILLDGKDIRSYSRESYSALFSVVFQDFFLFSQSLGANVACSQKYDPGRAAQALQRAGFGKRLETLEQGLDTVLYKDLTEDGVNISGGEAQKVALARALYQDRPCIILDEPTAALDPIAEAEVYTKFHDIADGKTAVYISHRLASCKFCDWILVFQNGQIIQQGTHSQLLADTTGVYHKLWEAQAQYYRQ